MQVTFPASPCTWRCLAHFLQPWPGQRCKPTADLIYLAGTYMGNVHVYTYVWRQTSVSETSQNTGTVFFKKKKKVDLKLGSFSVDLLCWSNINILQLSLHFHKGISNTEIGGKELRVRVQTWGQSRKAGVGVLQVSKDFLLYGSGVQRLPSHTHHLPCPCRTLSQGVTAPPPVPFQFIPWDCHFIPSLEKEYREGKERKISWQTSSAFLPPYRGGSGSFLVPALGSRQHREVVKHFQEQELA